VIAFALLGPFTALIGKVLAGGNGQIALVSFHTVFNLLGIVLFLPFTDVFAKLVTGLVHERGPVLTRRFGRNILRDADAATDAAAATVEEIAHAQLAYLARRLERAESRRTDGVEMRDIADALAATRSFITTIAFRDANAPRARRIAATLHLLDHLERLYFRCTQVERIAILPGEHRLSRLGRVLGSLSREAAQPEAGREVEKRLNRLRKLLRAERERYRQRTIMLASTGRVAGEAALGRLSAVRWLHRVTYHLWRIQRQIDQMHEAGAPGSALREAAVEVMQD